MKPRLRWKWLPIQPRPDPEYGLPVPRSAHGLSFLRHRNSFVIYGGEGSGSNLGEHQQCWECYLGDFTLSSAAFTPQSFPSARNHQVPQWRRIDFLATNPPANLPPVRRGPAQAVVADRYLYVFGGRQKKCCNDLWQLDAADWTWTRVHDENGLAPPPRAHATLLAPDGDAALFLVGGTNAQRGALQDVHRLDVLQHTWHPLLEGWDPDRTAGLRRIPGTDRWVVVREDASRRGGVAAVWPRSGVAMLFGGQVSSSTVNSANFANDMILWDVTTGKFVTRVEAPPDSMDRSPPLWPEARAWSAADGWEDEQGMGHWFLFGGLGGDGQLPRPLQDVWKLEIHKVS
jgi:Galactose oxidase, central domain